MTTTGARPAPRVPRGPWLPGALIAGLLAAACGDATGPEGRGLFSLGFREVVASGSGAAAPAVEPWPSGPGIARSVSVTGPNGTLTVERVDFVLDDFALKRDRVACEGAPDACEEFRAGPVFVALELDGAVAPAVSQMVPAARYEELAFRMDHLELDAADPTEAEVARDLLQRIRGDVPGWPQNASMRIAGSFAASGGGEVRSFQAFLDPDLRVEIPLNPPVEIRDERGGEVVILVDPRVWFRRGDGSVVDPSGDDYARTGKVLHPEFSVADGFVGVELSTR